MQSDADFDQMLADSAQYREGMPFAASRAAAIRQQKMNMLIQQMNQERAAATAKRSSRMKSVPQLMAAERSSEYTNLHDPGITRGQIPADSVPYNAFDARKAQIAAQYADTPQDTGRKAQLVAAMNQRAQAATAARAALTPVEKQNLELWSQDARAKRRDLGEQAAAKSRAKNVRLAAARGVMRPSALEQAYQDEVIKDPRIAAMKRALIMGQAQGLASGKLRQPAPPSGMDALRMSNPALYEELIRSMINKNNGGPPELATGQ